MVFILSQLSGFIMRLITQCKALFLVDFKYAFQLV